MSRHVRLAIPVAVAASMFLAAPAAQASLVLAATGIRVGAHPGYERVVVDFAGGRPLASGIHWTYVHSLSADPSDQRVSIAGAYYLRVVMHSAYGYDLDTGQPTKLPKTVTPNLPLVKQIKVIGDYEGYLSFGLGLSARVTPTIFTLGNPDRVVIDLPTTAGTATPTGSGQASASSATGTLPATGATPWPTLAAALLLMTLGGSLCRLARSPNRSRPRATARSRASTRPTWSHGGSG